MRTNATPEEVAALVQRHFDGDAKALAELIGIFQSLVRAAARRVLRCATDVDDAVQDTWLNFVRFGDRIADPERVGAWLWTVALNSARRIQRRDSRCIVADNVADLADAKADDVPDPDHALQRCERATVVPCSAASPDVRARPFNHAAHPFVNSTWAQSPLVSSTRTSRPSTAEATGGCDASGEDHAGNPPGGITRTREIAASRRPSTHACHPFENETCDQSPLVSSCSTSSPPSTSAAAA